MILLALVSLLAAGCGGGSAAPKVAAIGTTSTTAGQAAAPPGVQAASSSSALVRQAIVYSQCMRKHGEPGFPEPDSAGSFSLAGLRALDPNAPQFQAALRDCEPLRPVPSAQELNQDNTALLKFSACMRSHGEVNFPDFDLGSGTAARTARQYLKTIDPLSPSFQTAFAACRALLPAIIGSAIGSGSG